MLHIDKKGHPSMLIDSPAELHGWENLRKIAAFELPRMIHADTRHAESMVFGPDDTGTTRACFDWLP